MPEFAPGEAKIARAPITVRPVGLSCQAEVFLGPNEMTKVATSGRISFTSTGTQQSVRLPVIMPSTVGSYHVYADVYAEGMLIARYQAIKDVTIAPVFEEAQLSGWVYDADTSERIAGVTVTLDGKTTTSDYGGVYAFSHLTPGSYTIRFSKEGYEDYVRDIVLVLGPQHIHGYLTPIAPTFDPWSYDFNHNGVIDLNELLAAANDYNAGIITKDQLDQVTALWEQGPVLPTDYLSLSKDKLYTHLINGDVGKDWWSIPEPDRRELALKIINWWSVPLGGVSLKGQGDLNCVGNIYDTGKAVCLENALIRYCWFSGDLPCPSNAYYRHNSEWFCLCRSCIGDNFHLPVYFTYIDSSLGSASLLHAVVAIQVGEDRSDFNNWIFFQFKEANIKPHGLPGHVTQMPVECIVVIQDLKKSFISDSGKWCTITNWASYIAWWEIKP